MDKELIRLEREEKRTQLEIKKLANSGQLESAKLLAKNIISIRKQKERIIQSKSQLGSISNKTNLMNSNLVLANSMQKATQVMHTQNAQMNPQKMGKIMNEFSKQNQMMEMTEEMMDDAFQDDELDDEANEIADQIFDEIGIEATSGLKNPSNKVPKQKQKQNEDNSEEDEILKRLINLKN